MLLLNANSDKALEAKNALQAASNLIDKLDSEDPVVRNMRFGQIIRHICRALAALTDWW